MPQLIPKNKNLVIREVKPEKKKKGLQTADNELDRKSIGIIVAISDDESEYDEGQKILYNEYEAIDVPKMKDINPDDDLIIINVNDILAIINN